MSVFHDEGLPNLIGPCIVRSPALASVPAEQIFEKSLQNVERDDAFGGGIDYNDHERIWAALDKAHAKHPAMVLLHDGSQGAERIAACWTEALKL